jgi:hypothetical protein
MTRVPSAIRLAALSLTFAGAAVSAHWQATEPQVWPLVVSVPAARPWSDSTVTVKKGDELSFCATGEIFFGSGTATAGPAGVGDVDPRLLPVQMLPVGALIGSVNGVSFPIGAVTKMVKMPDSGRLLLGVNDWVFRDNSGSFRVHISRSPGMKPKDCSAP